MFTSPKLSILYLGKKNFDLVTKNLLTDSDLSQGTDKLLCMSEFCVILIAGTTCQVQFTFFFWITMISSSISVFYLFTSLVKMAQMLGKEIVRSFTFFDTYTSLGEVIFYIDANFSSLNFIIFKQG